MKFSRYALIITVPDCYSRFSYIRYYDTANDAETALSKLDLIFKNGCEDNTYVGLSAVIAERVMLPKSKAVIQRDPFKWIKGTHNGLIWSRYMPGSNKLYERFTPVNLLPLSHWNKLERYRKGG